MTDDLNTRVSHALGNVQNPRVGKDVVTAGMIQDLQVDDGGRVSLTFLLDRTDPATLVRQMRSAVRGVDGVSDVKVKVQEPTAAQGGPPGGAPAAQGRVVPPPPQPIDLPGLGHIIAVSSGKGGVGKSTVAANLSVVLAQTGLRVGIMDADIYGPNIPRMFGVTEQPPVRNQRIIPIEAHGVKLISLGLMIERDAPAIWRGPIITKILQQFLRDVDWGELDYFLVDLPPGTGDAQLSLVQSAQVRTAIIVTTPQEVSVGDGLRGAKMFERVGVPVLGIIENMSFFETPSGERIEIFSSGGGQRLAEELGVPLVGQIPLQAGMTEHADEGKPIVIAEPESPASMVFQEIAKVVRSKVAGKGVSLPVITG
jgi:ATP-binding protein involved in chromosome partitioning